eukprot:5815759-Amphidinium_carterae.1
MRQYGIDATCSNAAATWRFKVLCSTTLYSLAALGCTCRHTHTYGEHWPVECRMCSKTLETTSASNLPLLEPGCSPVYHCKCQDCAKLLQYGNSEVHIAVTKSINKYEHALLRLALISHKRDEAK